MIKKFLLLMLCLNLFSLQAQERLDPLKTKDSIAQNKWVDSIFNGMTIDEKIGQLFMIQAYSNMLLINILYLLAQQHCWQR